jgi:uncharacterized SAM-dependent methyltransferase
MNALPSAVRLQITRVPYRHDFDPSEHARETSDFCGEDAVLIEYGAGAAVKTEILINAFRSPRLYVPVDIAGDFLGRTVARLRSRFGSLQTRSIIADFTAPLQLPPWVPGGRRVAFFPGSTLGNLDIVMAAAYLLFIVSLIRDWVESIAIVTIAVR